eukprot:TRINITY_DN1230_c0_g1_i2.p1 TRINITY_DN1230_c0_g1~~TRINITY_DN1230_c0_g1_i2.p1  ORF type:complete len:379 (-),score=143.04 TRINITY_DN1230_c0_g1_i2:12-1148(-)
MDGNVFLDKQKENAEDETKALLESIAAGETADDKTMKLLKKRKLVSYTESKTFHIGIGEQFAKVRQPEHADVTAELLHDGSWKDAQFKEYNFSAKGMPTTGGHLHPLLKVRAEYRKIFLNMGFEEMPTNNWVESSFWNFDTLFQPQQHPARDAHDTFFVSDPQMSQIEDEEYLQRVKKTHEDGGYGSIGWRYDWSENVSRENILRTHTTAVSSRMLYALAQQEEFTPKKYFSIDRVFRNEAMDHTHLAEFHQIEGMIADYDLTLADLIGAINQFFAAVGVKKIRFKPAYNPYTEPSMEVFGFHEGHQKWVEIGNSGMFRPEMLRPMGLPENVRVIAWGLSLERPTMIKYKIHNIRDLFGHKVNTQFIEKNPICRLDKE